MVRAAQELEPRSLSKETHLTLAPRSDSKCQALIRASAAAATEALRQAGFDDVRSLARGIHLWSTDIDPSVPMY